MAFLEGTKTCNRWPQIPGSSVVRTEETGETREIAARCERGPWLKGTQRPMSTVYPVGEHWGPLRVP